MPDPITVIIPARNEAATIAPVVETMLALPDVAEVVVIDNGSTAPRRSPVRPRRSQAALQRRRMTG